MSLFNELKRRNVFRVGVTYVVAAWVVAQVADLVLENFGAPQRVMQSLLVLLAIGFIVTLIIAWAYEITPDGIKRDSEVVRDNSVSHHTTKRLGIITVCLVVVAVGLFLADKLLFDRIDQKPSANPTAVGDTARQPSADKSQAADTRSDQSIAVMPFVALSTDESDEYFGKGIAEELLNSLAKFPDLKVAARTSAFSFGDKDVDLREVGEALDVAHVLEGSVRRSGERLRITAQLIRVADGFHMWSETYERQLTDIFDIQDEIVAELSRVLQIRLGVGAGAGRAVDHNVNAHAYEQYLRGLDLWWRREFGQNRIEAITSFRRATELDPGFADAWSAYGSSLSMSSLSHSGQNLSQPEFLSKARTSLLQALKIDSQNIRALSGLVYLHSGRALDIPAAKKHLQQALTIAPNDAFTQYAASQFYWATGDVGMMIQANDRAMSLDPLNRTTQRSAFQKLSGIGRYSDSAAPLESWTECKEGECRYGHLFSAYYLMVGALVSSHANDVRRRLDELTTIRQFMSDSSTDDDPYIGIMQKFAEFSVNGIDDSDHWRSLDISDDGFADCYLPIVSILAQMGEIERALDLLPNQESSTGYLPGGNECWYPLMPGRYEMPEIIRRSPRYHDFWSSPGFQEVAEIRRANGQTAGLPLPIDGE